MVQSMRENDGTRLDSTTNPDQNVRRRPIAHIGIPES